MKPLGSCKPLSDNTFAGPFDERYIRGKIFFMSTKPDLIQTKKLLPRYGGILYGWYMRASQGTPAVHLGVQSILLRYISIS